MDTMQPAMPTSVPMSFMVSGQASVEAMMRSSLIWAAGCKRLGEIMAETAQGHFDQTSAAWQAMGRVKTLKEAVDLQTGYARSTTEHALAGAKKLIEETNRLTQETVAPITEQLARISPASRFAR